MTACEKLLAYLRENRYSFRLRQYPNRLYHDCGPDHWTLDTLYAVFEDNFAWALNPKAYIRGKTVTDLFMLYFNFDIETEARIPFGIVWDAVEEVTQP